MSFFRCNIDREMANSGTPEKPFLWARKEAREYYRGRVKYCTITTEKRMENISQGNRPYYVKVYELLTVKLLGIKIRNKEQSWKYDKL